MNNADLQYLDIAQEIFQTGVDRNGRNGITRGKFVKEFRWDLRNGFPLLTTKRVAFKLVKAELLWFLDAGRETGYRLDNNKLRTLLGYACDMPTIWTNDCENPEKAWVREGKSQFPGDCGRIYGAQWRNWTNLRLIKGDMSVGTYWENQPIDQLSRAIELLRTDPYNRRNIVSAWNPSELDEMCLPPCHRDFTFYVEPDEHGAPKFVSLQMTQRSCDLFLGVPFNIASYALLLSMIAQVTGYVAKDIVITFLDVHIYEAHFDAFVSQFARQAYPLPTLYLNHEVSSIDQFTMNDIDVMEYRSHPAIKAPLL